MGCTDQCWLYRGLTRAALGRYEEALRDIDCFIDARPGFPGAEEARRDILKRLGR